MILRAFRLRTQLPLKTCYLGNLYALPCFCQSDLLPMFFCLWMATQGRPRLSWRPPFCCWGKASKGGEQISGVPAPPFQPRLTSSRGPAKRPNICQVSYTPTSLSSYSKYQRAIQTGKTLTFNRSSGRTCNFLYILRWHDTIA